MPAIPRGDQDGVDILAIEQFPQVAIQLAILVAIVLVNQSFASIPSALLNIGDRNAPHIVQTEYRCQVVRAAGTDPDDSQRNRLTRCYVCTLTQNLRRHNGR